MKAATYLFLFALQVACSFRAQGQQRLIFSSLEDLYRYAQNHSSSTQIARHQATLAKYETVAAQLGQWNLQGNTSYTLTENSRLGTNFIPAELVGGVAGTFHPLTFGQRYQSNLTFAPQIDLFNSHAAALVKAKKANQKIVDVNNLLNEKEVCESISAAYHNIMCYQSQIQLTTNSMTNADTLIIIMQDRQKEGLARIQDLNDAQANRLIVKDKLQQLEVQLAQQYNTLKILTDIDSAAEVTIPSEVTAVLDQNLPLTASSDLLQRRGEWRTNYQQALLQADKKWVLPTLNLFSSFGWQQTTNNKFFDSSKWFATSYVGLRLSIPLLPESSKVASVKYDRINLQIARNALQHDILQDQINNNQLQLDYKKAEKSYRLALQIEGLRQDSYYKNLNIYREGILPATELINSFDSWLNSGLNTIAFHSKSP